MSERKIGSFVGVGLAAVALHAGLLPFSFVLGMSSVAAHGPGATVPAIGSKAGVVLDGVFGFSCLDLGHGLGVSALARWMGFVADLPARAAWAGTACG